MDSSIDNVVFLYTLYVLLLVEYSRKIPSRDSEWHFFKLSLVFNLKRFVSKVFKICYLDECFSIQDWQPDFVTFMILSLVNLFVQTSFNIFLLSFQKIIVKLLLWASKQNFSFIHFLLPVVHLNSYLMIFAILFHHQKDMYISCYFCECFFWTHVVVWASNYYRLKSFQLELRVLKN